MKTVRPGALTGKYCAANRYRSATRRRADMPSGPLDDLNHDMLRDPGCHLPIPISDGPSPYQARIQTSRSRPQRVPGALVHGLRHTYATELASSDVSV